jgi:hypothetical protein|tara:strand:+ start:673 stop:1557 length:885 start_codon:yes stop_codon:yes gene_type:complete
MAETLNVNVIVAAKEEYTKQLITILQPDIYEVIRNIFINSQRNNIRRSLSYSNFQKELKNVPSWSNYTLEEYLQKINQKYPYLMDLITAIFVSHVKILACVRIKADDKSIKIKVPNLNNFLHKIVINVSEQVYYYPAVIDHDKDKFFSIISGSITDAISNQVPIEYILNEYLSGAFDEEDIPPLLDTQEVNEPLFDPNDDVESEPDDDFKRDIQISDIGRMATQLNVDVPADNTDEVVVPPVSQPPVDVFENVEQSHISKSDNIEDSSDDDSDDEDYGDEDEKKTVITTQPALF